MIRTYSKLQKPALEKMIALLRQQSAYITFYDKHIAHVIALLDLLLVMMIRARSRKVTGEVRLYVPKEMQS